MTKDVLLQKINDSRYQYDKTQLNSWVRALPSRAKISPSVIKAGDVFMHPMFMHPMFMHPYVFLKKVDDYWICTLLTSNGEFEEVLCQCNSRFFGDSYITKILFTTTEVIGGFMCVYDNKTQLDRVLKDLQKILG